MTAIPDAELKIAVAKKLGYSIIRQPKCDDVPEIYIIVVGGQRQYYAQSEAEAWNQVPDFPNSLDACEPIFEWFKAHKYAVDMYQDTDGTWWVNIDFDAPKLSRALCLAFLEVKE